MKVSVYWLAKATGKHPGTIRKRLADVDADKSGKYDSATALEAIFVGRGPGENGFISTPEAVRLLTIEKARQVQLQNEIVRGERIPREDVDLACSTVFKAIAGILKANCGKFLTVEQINEIFSMMRETARQLREDSDAIYDAAYSAKSTDETLHEDEGAVWLPLSRRNFGNESEPHPS